MLENEKWLGFWPQGAERLLDSGQVQRALDQQAERLAQRLAGHDRVTLMVLMNGGMYPAIELARRLRRPILMDHVHATRYRGATRGGELQWGRWPSVVEGSILLVDDIFDEGYTLQAVRDKLLAEGAEAVVTAVLTRKAHDRGLPRDWVDDAALTVPDRYVFGCGMDCNGYWRQLEEIWALPPEQV
ncbi:MAG: phosphoribosyltransferase family protein [Wenzhouxiangella sp.]